MVKPVQIYKWLYPVSWLYGIGVGLRNKLFDWGILKERLFDIPVISVGNITVGGTGKTPHTEYLIRLLQDKYQVGVLSRGYKRKSKGFVLATADTPVHAIGDEPYQMKQKYPAIHMAVDADRCHGIDSLCREAPDTEVVILDDAYQHRYVKPGLSILLVDYHRLLCDDALMPAGRMREPQTGKKRAQVVILTKCPKNLKPVDYQALSKRMALYPHQRLFFTSLAYGQLYPLFTQAAEFGLSTIGQDTHVLLVTGIASPAKLIADLSPHCGPVDSLAFSDHHDFSGRDLAHIRERFLALPEGRRIIITTEKDAVRLRVHSSLDEALKPYMYVLPVEVTFQQNQQESFNSIITDYVSKNPRNSRLSERQDAYPSRDSHHSGHRTR